MLPFIPRLSLTWWFALAAFTVIAILGYVLTEVLDQAILEGSLENMRAEARDTAARRVLHQLTPADLAAPLSSQRLAELDRFVGESVVSTRTARVKIWAPDGRVVYSSKPEQVGQVFPVENELKQALEGKTVSELSHLDKPENVGEVEYGTLLEVYTPIVFPGSQQVAGVFEVYQIYDPVANQIAAMRRYVSYALGGGLSALYLALLGIVHSGARTIDRQNQDLAQTFAQIRGLNAELEQRVSERTEQLAEAKQRYQALYDDNPAMYLTVDAGGRILSVNQFGAEQLGYRVEELVGQSVRTVVAPEDHDAVSEKVAACVRHPGRVEHWEVRKLRKDSSALWVREGTRGVLDPEGSLVVLMVSEDITERRQAEEARARLTAILEATTDYVSTTNVNGHMLYMNRAGRSMLGIGEYEPVTNLSLLDFFPASARSLLVAEGIPTVTDKGVWSAEVTLLHREGRELPVSLVSLAHKTPDGAVEFLSYIARDISERKRLEERLSHLASHDPLTDLFNRRRFNEELDIQLAQGRRYRHHSALVFFDLDHFKTINDSLGHRAGDQLLSELAGVLRQRLRSSDLLARLGGDEFAIFLPHTGEKEARVVAERILQSFQQHTIVLDGQPIAATASIGIALYPDHGETGGELVAHADLAMYQAKENGRGQYCLYTPQLESRLVWEQRIRDALEQERFVLYYQPILDLSSNRISHYEVLLRMQGDGDELIAPGEIFPVAERFGLVHAIDRWVVRQAIQLVAHHRRRGRELCLEVNLSGKSFDDPELIPMIARELAATGIPPGSLIFETSETATMANLDQAKQLISALKDLGCRFALDDFGVGFSSFHHLKQLPVDYLKIDGDFIRNVRRDVVDQHLVRAMLEVAHGLGKQTIAEFVGDEETVQLLQSYGVDYAQGFYIAEPRPITELNGSA